MRPKKPGREFGKKPSFSPAKSSGKPGKTFHKSSPAPARAEREHRSTQGGTSGGTKTGGTKPGLAGGQWLYGIHAVQAALANPRRTLGRAVLTPRATETLGEKLLRRVRVETLDPGGIDKLLPPGAVHQGAALEAKPLKSLSLDEILAAAPTDKRRVVLVLDQLTDPHNVGAILRTALAFDVAAVVVQDRNAPPQTGALAKAASGALDMVPYVEVVNIARALDELSERGFWRIALAGDGEQSLAEAVPVGDVALVLGSEGDGIRRLVRERCEASARIPISRTMESLNVSNAAAIALYELRRS